MNKTVYILDDIKFFNKKHLDHLKKQFRIKKNQFPKKDSKKYSIILVESNEVNLNTNKIISEKITPDIIFTDNYRNFNLFPTALILPLTLNHTIMTRIINYLHLTRMPNSSNKKAKIIKKYKTQLNNIIAEINNLQIQKKELQKPITNSTHKEKDLQRKEDFFRKELKLAGELQKRLLPKLFPFEKQVSFASMNLPSKYIGGDFYDVIKIDENKFAIYIIDVAGHGIRSAIIASMSKTLFRNSILNSDSLSQAMSYINKEFHDSIFNDDDFLTTFVAVIDLEKMEATYVNAGHPFPLIMTPNGEIIELQGSDFLMGVFDNSVFQEHTIEFELGYRFLLYTDGILETVGEQNNQFGKQGLKDIVIQNSYLNLSDLSNKILNELLFFSKNPTFTDDLTLVLFEIL